MTDYPAAIVMVHLAGGGERLGVISEPPLQSLTGVQDLAISIRQAHEHIPLTHGLEQCSHEVSDLVRHVDFQQAIDEATERLRYDKAQHFLFDLEQVSFMPSSCLGLLLAFHQEVEHCRGRIALLQCNENVAMLFKITQLDEVFGLFDDVEEAFDAMNPSQDARVR